MDNAGNLYISDTNDHRIRKVNTTGIISTVAGNGSFGFSGDNGPAISAMLNSPEGIAVDSAGNLYIADASNSRVRKVSPEGVITTVAGNGNVVDSGDGGPATSAAVPRPEGVTVDSAGNLYIGEGRRIRKVNAAGIISTVAGTGVLGFSGDGGPGASAQIRGRPPQPAPALEACRCRGYPRRGLSLRPWWEEARPTLERFRPTLAWVRISRSNRKASQKSKVFRVVKCAQS
jgi:hypothetical protein